MFPRRYFPASYFAPRYWPIGAGVIPPPPTPSGPGAGWIVRAGRRFRKPLLDWPWQGPHRPRKRDGTAYPQDEEVEHAIVPGPTPAELARYNREVLWLLGLIDDQDLIDAGPRR